MQVGHNAHGIYDSVFKTASMLHQEDMIMAGYKD